VGGEEGWGEGSEIAHPPPPASNAEFNGKFENLKFGIFSILSFWGGNGKLHR